MHHLYVDTRLSRIKIAVLKMFIDETLFEECLQSFGYFVDSKNIMSSAITAYCIERDPAYP